MGIKTFVMMASALLAWPLESGIAQNARAPIPPLAVSNTSRFVGDGRYTWTVFLYGTRVKADQVQCVEYTLHPTFPNPVRRVCARGKDTEHAFALSSNGWGEFTIDVRIFFRDGKQQRISYQLKLSQ